MANISVGHCKISNIIQDAENGQMKIPQFQRQFVWSVDDCAKLMDSILKGYPVGSFIYWKTKTALRVVRNIGGFNFPIVPDDDYAFYILDGQQRITSIIASVTGQKIDNDDYSRIFVNLKANVDEDIVITDIKDFKEDEYIPLKDVYNPDLAAIVHKYPNSVDIISDYINKLKGYEFSKIELSDAELDVATEVFTRINTSGKRLTIFEIMCARMYNESPEFDLYEQRQEQKNNWQISSYDTIDDITVLQAVSVCLRKDCRGKTILSLNKDDFIRIWNEVDKAFDETIDYFRGTYKIPVSKLVPYDALFVPFVYYFYKKKKQRPSGNEQKYLRDYFWRSAFSSRFTEGAVSKINQDIVDVIDVILAGKRPSYEQGLVITEDSIKREGGFSAGSAYIKGILNVLCSKGPLSFIDGHKVTIDNSWLSQGNSKNYHHFFPKDYMKKNKPEIDERLVNHIVNITIVDGWLNKGKIKAKAPSEYMKEFKDLNKDIDSHMKTHLIDDLYDFGVFKDDYENFFKHRIEAIHKEMVALIDPHENDELRLKINSAKDSQENTI